MRINVVPPNVMLMNGLLAVNYKQARIQRSSENTNRKRFRAHFGASPEVCCTIWEEFQNSEVQEARIPAHKLNLKDFLMALHTLRKYPTEFEREAIFDVSPKTGRNKSWYYIRKIQALKRIKIVWPDDVGELVWIISVDGQHCWKQEPTHRIWAIDSKHYSHKYNKAGWCYELGISLTKSRLVWMNGVIDRVCLLLLLREESHFIILFLQVHSGLA